MRNFIYLFLVAALLTGCGAKKLTPAQMNTVEYLGHLRGTFGGSWVGPDGHGYPTAISRSMSDRGIRATLDVPGMPSSQLDRVESKLRSFAAKTQGTYERLPAAATLTWKADRFLSITEVRGARPDAYERLYDLADQLNKNPDLLVLVHGHNSMTKYAVERGLEAGRQYTYDFLVALYTVQGLDPKRFASFGCTDGDGETLSLTLVPKEFVAFYPGG